MQRRGFVLSLSLHIAIFLLLYAGLPFFTHKDETADHQVISVEVLPISELTNVKARKMLSKPKEEKKEPITKNQPKASQPEPEKKADTKPAPKVPTEALKPEAERVKVKPLEKPKMPEPPKKEEPKKPEKKKDEQKDPFASVLKSVEELQEQPKDDNKAEENFDQVMDSVSNMKQEDEYKPGLPMTLSEKDAIRQQIAKNWSVVSGAKDAGNMVVSLKLSLAPDGTVRSTDIIDKARYQSDPFFRATVDSAVRAVYKSSPLQNLPPEKYDVRDGWREIELTFDPKDMFY